MPKGFVLLNCDMGAEEYVAGELRQMDGIVNAHLTFGTYDVIVEIETASQTEFEKMIAAVRGLSRVVSTMTLNILDS